MSIERYETVIVGAGFSGLGMAIKLKEAGHTDFVVLDKATEVGGTWQVNTYPGCACDVPSRLYSFSFAQNPNWSRAYSPQPEIFAYLRDLADRYGLRPYLRLGTTFLGAAWDDAQGLWEVQLAGGKRLWAKFLVSAMGGLSRPMIPKLPGLETFEGTSFHSQQWNHAYPLEGKRVAVIGTGASAIQFVPQIAPKVEKLELFQRTPPWIIPRPDRAFSGFEKSALAAFPPLLWLLRFFVYVTMELRLIAFIHFPKLMRLGEKLALRHLESQVADPALRKTLTPDFSMGCKRVLISNDYFPALTRPNVSVVTSGIREVRAHSIVTADGVEHPVDCIVFGTGFRTTDFIEGIEIRGRTGVTLEETWKNGMEAYLGTTVAGFPNLFLLTGPNTGIGHTSLLIMIEAQLAYVIDAIRLVTKRALKSVEVKPEAQRAFIAEIDRDSVGTAWTSGCKSWYLDAAGRNRVVWPQFTFNFARRTRRFDVARYHCETPAPAIAETPLLRSA